MSNFDHLPALESRLIREKQRFQAAKTQKERDLRAVWIAQVKKEIKAEMEFLGLTARPEDEDVELSDDELLARLDKIF